jgi:hypothetical protein
MRTSSPLCGEKQIKNHSIKMIGFIYYFFRKNQKNDNAIKKGLSRLFFSPFIILAAHIAKVEQLRLIRMQLLKKPLPINWKGAFGYFLKW